MMIVSIGSICDVVNLLIPSFVGYACDFVKSKTSLISMKFSTDVQHRRHIALLTFLRSRSKLKVIFG